MGKVMTSMQLTPLMKQEGFTGTVREYADQNGYLLLDVPPAKKPHVPQPAQGTTRMVVISSASVSKVFVSINRGYLNRTEAWVKTDWLNTTHSSRPEHREVLMADDVMITLMPPMFNVTEADKDNLHSVHASVLVQYVEQEYKIIGQVPSEVRVLLNAMLAEHQRLAAPEESEEPEA